MNMDIPLEEPVPGSIDSRSDDQILMDINQKRKELVTRKAHLTRLLAQNGANRPEENIEEALAVVVKEIKLKRPKNDNSPVPEDQKAWEKCEATLLKIALTEQERLSQFKKLLEIGRGAREPYHQFAMRVDRDVRASGISDDSEILISLLTATVKEFMLDIMITRLQVLKQEPVLAFKSISEFTRILGGLTGPHFPQETAGNDNPSPHRRETHSMRRARAPNHKWFNPKGKAQIRRPKQSPSMAANNMAKISPAAWKDKGNV
ncbi:hypothetical protein BX616_009799 [Lobosporangium transversale]|nr:hypothetical protein BX616_009799 [Lobosporangium transversale]